MSALEVDLLEYLQLRFGHVSYEQVCSGRGLRNIYAFLRERGAAAEPTWLTEQLERADDPTPVIVGAALRDADACELCTSTLSTFISILGAEAGNLALKLLATGGVYLGGGIPPRILPALRQGPFMQSFRRKGRMSELLLRLGSEDLPAGNSGQSPGKTGSRSLPQSNSAAESSIPHGHA